MQTFCPFLYLMSFNTPKVTTLSLGKGFTCRGASKNDVKLLTSLHLTSEFLEKCMFSLRRRASVELEEPFIFLDVIFVYFGYVSPCYSPLTCMYIVTCKNYVFNSVTDCDRMADTLKFGPEWYVNEQQFCSIVYTKENINQSQI